MKSFFKDKQFSFQTLRLIGEAVYGSSDIGEVMCACEKIIDGDFESWCIQWSKLAERVHEFADKCYSEENFVSASEAYLRASNYYRTAEFYLHENLKDPRIKELYNKSLQCFSFVVKLNPSIIEAVKIPYEKTNLPAHFYHTNDGKKRPTLIAMTGFDGTKEEMYGLALNALKRGINCLAFEGPGQGEVIRNQNLAFRYDYEKVVTPVVDYLLSRDEVDSDKIILLGESFGGYLAPRAAAFEYRIAACIANTGVFDFMGFRRAENVSREEFFKEIYENEEEANIEMKRQMNRSSEMKWCMTHGMYVFGVETPAKWMLKAKEYYLGDVYKNIKCPTLVVDGEDENIFPRQAKQLYNALTCPKEYMLFTREEGAAAHCQIGAKLISNERIFNWIKNTILN